MIRVGFDEAYLTCRDRLSEQQLRVIDPRWPWFRAGEAYIAMSPTEGGIWVHMVCAFGHRWLRDVAKDALRSDIKTIAFECADKTLPIVRYYGGTAKDVGTKYPDGSTAWMCIVPVRSRRTW